MRVLRSGWFWLGVLFIAGYAAAPHDMNVLIGGAITGFSNAISGLARFVTALHLH